MSNDVFDGQLLAEKLSKLNNSQQSIESLSRWCISHRKKAKQIVETWDKLFNSSQKEQCVSFLYLANDILQNSRRKGSEFVNEFWKVLPLALKHVYDNGDEYGKKAVSRLVDIWEERKVFGSRGQGLKDEMLGKSPPPLLVSNGKNSNPIKIVKRDSQSVRIKLSIGGMPEKIVTAFQTVHDEQVNEEAVLNKCKTAVQHVGKLEVDAGNTSGEGNQQRAALVDELKEQENILQQCVVQLESSEATRAALVSQLKEALLDQESKLGLVRAQLQVARGRIEQASNMRQRLTSPTVAGPQTIRMNPQTEAPMAVEPNMPSVQATTTPPKALLTQPVISFAPLKTTEEDSKKAAAAAVAAKLAASTSSAQMLTSVLSSLVAEEAASNGGLKSSGFASIFSPEKRPRLEKPMPVSDGNNSDAGSASYFTPVQQQSMANMPLAPPTSVPPMSQANQMQAPFPPPPPPPPPLPLVNPPAKQYVQSSGMMVGVMPYGYGTTSLPPPPPMLSHVPMGLSAPAPQPPQQLQSPQLQQQQQSQQPATGGGYYRPPGIAFYGQSHQPTPPPVPRQ
ncbi:regulation of nuclear pre-mRNA domain-containing protein 1B-like [Vitis riparia]|uniref:regulation of nuclear pre-mRNA domain-containing protein 1B-like n=1 Tax=Vitis riparia TaxID=96939 RepID=UPI00155A4DA4|nr:regulation of nuclear pre-mRNA domain-containing protein 1B-like [Vitis riparia]XP_034694905.1 regulation of nuclear pre-mRNA domain-containing protein 1B-like [Vitis riparia]